MELPPRLKPDTPDVTSLPESPPSPPQPYSKNSNPFDFARNDASGYSQYLESYDRHVDSILPASQARAVISRRSLLPLKPTRRAQEDLGEDELQKLLNARSSFRDSLGSPLGSPLVSLKGQPELFQDQGHMAQMIQDEVALEFEQEKQRLHRKCSEELALLTQEETRRSEKFWKNKVEALARALEQLEREHLQGLPDLDASIEHRLREERPLLERDIELSLKAEYELQLERKLSLFSGTVRLEEAESSGGFPTTRDQEHDTKINVEKEYWKRENAHSIVEDCKTLLANEQARVLQNRRTQFELQMKEDVGGIVREVRECSEHDVREQLARLDQEAGQRDQEIYGEIKKQCFHELKNDREFLLKTRILEKIDHNTENSLRKELAGRIEMEIKLRKTETLRNETFHELELQNELVRKHITEQFKDKLESVEDEFHQKQAAEVGQTVQAQLDSFEKDLNISYLRQKQKLNQQLRKQYETTYQIELKELKDALTAAKAENSRLKSLLNINLKQFAEQRKQQLALLKAQEEKLEKKIRQLQYEQYYNEQYSRCAPVQLATVKSEPFFKPEPYKFSIVSPVESDLLVSPPPRVLSGHTVESLESPRRLLNVDSSGFLATKLAMQNVETAKPWYVASEESKSSPKAESPDSYYKQSPVEGTPPERPKNLYDQLLQKHHGIIEPRYK